MNRRRFGIACIFLLATLVAFAAWYLSTAANRRLINAIKTGDTQAAVALLEERRFTSSDYFGRAVLIQAINSNEKRAYVKALESGANPGLCAGSGVCVMNATATLPDSFWLSEALAHGGDPNAPNPGSRHNRGRTPIFYAVEQDRVANVKLLIKAGADLNRLDGDGEILLRVARYWGSCEIMASLLEAGADPTQKNDHGYNFVDSMRNLTESLIHDDDDKPWFRKVRAILIECGLLKPMVEGE